MPKPKKKGREGRGGGGGERNGLDKPRCKCTCAFLSFTYYIPSTQFFLHFRENILVGLRRKQLDPTNFFPSPHSNQTLTKKVFLSIFSLKFSIYLILPPNKHTLTVSLVGGMKKWEARKDFGFPHFCLIGSGKVERWKK